MKRIKLKFNIYHDFLKKTPRININDMGSHLPFFVNTKGEILGGKMWSDSHADIAYQISKNTGSNELMKYGLVRGFIGNKQVAFQKLSPIKSSRQINTLRKIYSYYHDNPGVYLDHGTRSNIKSFRNLDSFIQYGRKLHPDKIVKIKKKK